MQNLLLILFFKRSQIVLNHTIHIREPPETLSHNLLSESPVNSISLVAEESKDVLVSLGDHGGSFVLVVADQNWDVLELPLDYLLSGVVGKNVVAESWVEASLGVVAYFSDGLGQFQSVLACNTVECEIRF